MTITKWPEVAFTLSFTTTVITTFLSTVFAQFGNPAEFVSDNGTQLPPSEFTEFLAVRDTTHRKMSLYYPQANGAIEHWNCVFSKTHIHVPILCNPTWYHRSIAI